VWFYLQWYISIQKKIGNGIQRICNQLMKYAASSESWCLVCCKCKDCWTCVFDETFNCERYVQALLWQFIPEVTEEERIFGWFQQATAAHCVYVYA
jgi:hypothetical protein